MSIGVMSNGGRGADGTAVTARPADDFYPTPMEATLAFVRAEAAPLRRWGGRIWEPACGDGAMARGFADAGFEVEATDLTDRGYGRAGVDFLLTEELLAPIIVTNPPFFLAREFIEHALFSLRAGYVAMLLKATYFHASSRQDLFLHRPPSWIYPLAWRLDFKNLGAPVMECAWFVWDRTLKVGWPNYRPLMKPAIGEELPGLEE